MDEEKDKVREVLIMDFENKRVIHRCNIPGFPGQMQEYITFEAIQDLNKQIEEDSAGKKDKKLKDNGCSTKADVVNYVKGMNTHVLIWANSAWNQAEILRGYIGKKKLSKSPALEAGFDFIRSNIKSVVQLVDRMEEGLNIRRE